MIVLRVMVRVPLLLVGSLIMAVFTSPKLALLFVVLNTGIQVSLLAMRVSRAEASALRIAEVFDDVPDVRASRA